MAEHLAPRRRASSASSTPTCRCRRSTGDGVDALVGELEARLPEGPHYYPDGVVTDQPETFLAAELLREKLLPSRATSCRTPSPVDASSEMRGPRPRRNRRGRRPHPALAGVVLVERDSQKGIVIGKGGAVLKEAGTRAREELEALLGTRVHLETQVKVERDWQRRAALPRPPRILNLEVVRDKLLTTRGPPTVTSADGDPE